MRGVNDDFGVGDRKGDGDVAAIFGGGDHGADEAVDVLGVPIYDLALESETINMTQLPLKPLLETCYSSVAYVLSAEDSRQKRWVHSATPFLVGGVVDFAAPPRKAIWWSPTNLR